LERLQIVRDRNPSYFGSKYKFMCSSSKVLRRFELTLHKCLVDDYLGGDAAEFAFLPRFHLLAHGLEVALHPIDTDRNAID